jgi:hypothetical protein
MGDGFVGTNQQMPTSVRALAVSASRISIHRCSKGMEPVLCRRVYRGDSGAMGPRLCRMLQVNFREHPFWALG